VTSTPAEGDAPLPPYGTDQTTGTGVEYPEQDAVLEKVVGLAVGGDREGAITLYMTKLGRSRDEAEIFVEGF
jgi:hypothetical protein